MKDDRGNYWFRPNRLGIGGRPATWQGWLATALLVAALLAPARLGLPPPARAAIVVSALTAFLVLLRYKTTGGLRWRWGGRDQGAKSDDE